MTPAAFVFVALAAGPPTGPALRLAGPVELGKSERWALVGFSPDGRTLATAAEGTWRKAGPIRLWDTRTGRQRVAFAAGWGKLETMRFSPDGSLVAAHDGKRGMGVWDARTGKRVTGFRPPTPFGNWVNFWFSPDGHSLLYQDHGKESSLKVWDIKAGRGRAAIQGEPSMFAFSPDGRRLATGTTAPTHDRRDAVMLWAWDPGKAPALLKKHPLAVDEVAFSPDLGKFATASRKGRDGAVEVRVRDLATGRTLASLTHRDPETHIQSLEFSPDGRLLMARGGGGTKLNWKTKATVWDITSRPPRALGTWAEAPAFSPDGRLLAVRTKSRVVLRGVGTGKVKGELTRRGDTADPGFIRMVGWTPLPSVLFSPDGRLVAVTKLHRGPGGLSVARVWQVDPLREVRALDGCVQVLFSLRGSELAALSGDGCLKVWAVSVVGRRLGP